MARNARFGAIETLRRHQKSRLPLPGIFESVVRKYRLTSVDRHLAMKISYGVLRQRDHLDRLLNKLCTRPITQMKPFVYQALSTGLYQLTFLDRIPPSAAVDETVKAVKEAGFPKPVQGFVNGVLRQSLRRRDELPGPDTPGPDNHPPLNHPAWLVQRWESHFGTAAMLEICLNNNQEPVLCLRVAPRSSRSALIDHFAEQGIVATPGNYSTEAVLLPGYHGAVTELPGYSAGHFQVQDQAAQLASLLLGPFEPGKKYLDCCAGLGGKTTHLAALADQPGSELVAVEPDTKRFRLLQDNLARLTGGSGATIINTTLAEFNQSDHPLFDKVLVDAPCSGTGVIGRQPDIRWNRDLADLARFRKEQTNLLDQAARLVSPGGTLVYATCSIEPEENLEVVSNFLTHNTSFSHSDCTAFLPILARDLIVDGCFAPLPGFGIDGFFAARLTKM